MQKQKSFGRTKVILESWPAYRLADVFVANFEVSFEERLFMLDAVDLRQRLSKATEIVTRHLQVIRLFVLLQFELSEFIKMASCYFDQLTFLVHHIL